MLRLVVTMTRVAAAALLCLVSVSFVTVSAGAVAVDGITSITISPTTSRPHGRVTTTIRWCVPDGTVAGDTMTLQLPVQLVYFPDTFTVTDPGGATVANVAIDNAASPAMATFTFTSYVQTHQNTCGDAWFVAEVDQDTAYYNTTQTLSYVLNGTTTFTQELTIVADSVDRTVARKWGIFTSSTDRCWVNGTDCILWGIDAPAGPYTSAIITDTLPAGYTVNCSRIYMDRATVDSLGYTHYDADYPNYTVLSCSGNTVSVRLDEPVPAGYLARLYLYVSVPPSGGAETVYTNQASVQITRADGTTSTSTHSTAITSTQAAGGTGSGSGLSLTKSATVQNMDGDGATEPGDRIVWAFTVQNTGSSEVTGLSVTDPTGGPSTCVTTTLPAGATTTCTTAAYTITPADADAGQVDNTATASGTASGATVLSNPSSTVTPVVHVTGLRLTKSATTSDVNADGNLAVGDQITWQFLVENTGSQTVSVVAVNDPTAGSVTCSPTTLAAGESVTCTAAAHTITQAEVNAGSVLNTATATATAGGTPLSSNTSSTTTDLAQESALKLTKSAVVTDVNSNDSTDLGDRITWSFLVENTGTLTISNIVVDDPAAGVVTCPVASLDGGASATCTAAAHTITQTDVDNGSVNNTATATGTDAGGNTVAAPESSTSTSVTQSTGLTITKSAATTDTNADDRIAMGDLITWSFVVRNTGTVTLSNVIVDDPVAGTVTCAATVLAPGASTECSAEPHVVAAEDVSAGRVVNTARVRGSSPEGNPVNGDDPASTDTPVVPSTPKLELVGTAETKDTNGNGILDSGDTVVWVYTVKNVGDVAMTNVQVKDSRNSVIRCGTTTLAVGETTICRSEPQTITPADVAAGVITNPAQAIGLPQGAAPTDPPVESNQVEPQVKPIAEMLPPTAATTTAATKSKTPTEASPPRDTSRQNVRTITYDRAASASTSSPQRSLAYTGIALASLLIVALLFNILGFSLYTKKKHSG